MLDFDRWNRVAYYIPVQSTQTTNEIFPKSLTQPTTRYFCPTTQVLLTFNPSRKMVNWKYTVCLKVNRAFSIEIFMVTPF